MEKNMRNISFKPWRASRERERERVVFRNNGLRDIIMIVMLQFSTIKIDNDGLSDRVIVVVASYMCTMLEKQDDNLIDSLIERVSGSSENVSG